MCYTIERNYTSNKEFTGYKVVVEDKYGHYYSPFTGHRYQPGKMKLFRKKGKHCNRYNQLDYSKVLENRTAVFEKKQDAIELMFLMQGEFKSEFKHTYFKIIQITIADDLKYGLFWNNVIVSGKEIISVKK